MAQLVDARQLRVAIFQDGSRPSVAWIRKQQKRRAIPFVKLGRKVFFDPDSVRSALDSQHTIGHQ